jgi:hypothetical protein
MVVLLLLSLFINSTAAIPNNQPATPASPCNIVPAVGTPIASAGTPFPTPDCGTVVIQSTVNNGPVAPPYQQGYQITIDIEGTAIVSIKAQGTPTPSSQIVSLGQDRLQSLLQQLEQIGYFDLVAKMQGTPPAPPLVGGPTNTLSVWLNGQMWQVSGTGLSDDDLATLNQAQKAVADAVGVPVPSQ